jgi:hypothetical protein
MDASPDIISFLLLLFLAIFLMVVLKQLKRQYENYENAETERLPFIKFLKRPKLFWFCDSDINARNWADFGGRNTNAPNRGYLEVALNKVRKTQPEFDIIPLVGRDAVLRYLPGIDQSSKQLPKKLWREYVIANLLNTHGGLVMDGDSTLCIGPSFYPVVLNLPAATFGINPDESVASPLTAILPGPAPYVGWSQLPNHPAWTHAANFYNRLVLRGPQAWSAALARRANQTIWETQKTLGCEIIRAADGGRFANGKLRQLEDIFGTETMPDILPGTIYIPYDGEDLERRFEFNWFLRLSPAQLSESYIAWSKLANGSLIINLV